MYERGYSNNRKDAGNWTGCKVGVGMLKGAKYGIVAIKNLKLNDVTPIYEKNTGGQSKAWREGGKCAQSPP